MDGIQATHAPSELEATKWFEKHGIKPSTDGWIDGLPDGKSPVGNEKLFENISINALRADIPNMQPCLYRQPIMVFVGGGPSAVEFLDEIGNKARDPHYEVYCSNATAQWLIWRAIVPKYQVIIDPKPSKVADVAHQHPDITYLLGLQCDPALFDAVKGLKVEKFLAASAVIDDKKDTEIAKAACTTDDPHLVCIGGGTMMGTRAMTIANAVGHRKLEYYGFDGSVKMVDGKAECYAYDKRRDEAIIEVECEDGRKFYSTMTFARQADELNTFRKMMPWIDIKIHGDGFLAHMLMLDMAKEDKPAAYRCSPEYLELQKQMAPHYQGQGRLYAGRVYLIAAQLLKQREHLYVLDYGCGKKALEQTIAEQYVNLPGLIFDGYNLGDFEPIPHDLVTCTDVMEHVEPECVPAVLDHIQSLTKRVAFFAIDTQPARKTLPDGRNAHICLKPYEYWEGQIKKRFIVIESYSRGSTIMFVCQAFPKEQQ